jgi:hypothetical protein
VEILISFLFSKALKDRAGGGEFVEADRVLGFQLLVCGEGGFDLEGFRLGWCRPECSTD